MSNFHPMPRGDRYYLIAILVFACVAFLPWSHHIQVAGMALFGWLMAALMVFSPAIALLRLWGRRARNAGNRGNAKTSKLEKYGS